jgi:AcrR family transcriptional regulator
MQDDRRAHLVEVAAGLLASGGPEAVTTRSVALAAGVQAPTIYRLFGDKNGLLDAVVEHGFTTYVDQKHYDPADDPVESLRAGWELHVGFGLANPALFRLMHTTLTTPDAARAGEDILRQRVRGVAKAGRLRVSERRAEELIRSTGTGVVLTLIDQPADTRDEGLAAAAWESVCAIILTGERPAPGTGPAAAAVTLRAALPDLTEFTPAERQMLDEWLTRLK